MALFGWGVQPGDNRSASEVFYDRVMGGGTRQEFYVTNPAEKAKKVKRSWFIFQRGERVQRVARDPIMRQVLGEINQRIMREDDWRRDQGGTVISRGGMGQAAPWFDPGPPSGFLDTPQISGPPGGYWDGNGMWHDA